MDHHPILMAGLHSAPDSPMPWKTQEVDLAMNLKSVGCRYFKIQQNLDNLGDAASIGLLKRSIVSGNVKYDAKVKDAASTMARYIRRLVEYGADWVTVWIDESGLPEVEKLAHDHKDLVKHLCGVIELTTTPRDVTKKVHRCTREALFKRQGTAAAKFGMRTFIADIPGAAQFRAELVQQVPTGTFQLFCPGLRDEDEDAGGQEITGTPAEASAANVDFVIAERRITGASDPRYVYTGLRDELKK